MSTKAEQQRHQMLIEQMRMNFIALENAAAQQAQQREAGPAQPAWTAARSEEQVRNTTVKDVFQTDIPGLLFLLERDKPENENKTDEELADEISRDLIEKVDDTMERIFDPAPAPEAEEDNTITPTPAPIPGLEEEPEQELEQEDTNTLDAPTPKPEYQNVGLDPNAAPYELWVDLTPNICNTLRESLMGGASIETKREQSVTDLSTGGSANYTKNEVMANDAMGGPEIDKEDIERANQQMQSAVSFSPQPTPAQQNEEQQQKSWAPQPKPAGF